MSKYKYKSLYQKLYSENTLFNAWHKIYENGLKSDSAKTRESVREFKIKELQNIKKISRAIKNERFAFEGVHGVTVGEKNRPIALSPVDGRIVQRAILDIIQEVEGTQKYLNAPGSYGAIKSESENKKGVGPAIEAAVAAIKGGADHYYQSDIKSFFTQIPRKEVIDSIGTYIKEQNFVDILDASTNLEVKNIQRIPEKHRKFFDYNTVGTPQGCCLSPLMGNMLLYEFDVAMNQNGITCLRYLDDFIVLGKGWKAVRNAFDVGVSALKAKGLDVYTLEEKPTKAKSGHIDTGFDFLGVEIKGKNIRPNGDSRKRLLASIEAMMNETFNQSYEKRLESKQRDNTLINVLSHVNNKVLGWGNQYSFCNEDAIWGDMDRRIDDLIRKYLGRYADHKSSFDSKATRRILGVHLISESKKEQISWE